MGWWSRIKRRFGGSGGRPADSPRPVWREAQASPFGTRVLDLTPVTGALISMSGDPLAARRAVSWGSSVGDELDPADVQDPRVYACDLRYPAASALPPGLLYTPRTMEQKWVLAYREDQVLLARSWTGTVVGVADAEHAGEELRLASLRLRGDAGLDLLGDPVQSVDWLIRTHALGQLLPIPVHEDGLALLEATPIAAFSLYGTLARYAALGWQPAPPRQPLRSDGALLRAVCAPDLAQVRALVNSGAPVDAPSSCLGYTALGVATLRGDVPTVEALLALGADPNARADRGNTPLGIGVVHQAEQALLDLLERAGADPHAVNDDGFGVLHAAAESGNARAIPWLLARGLDLEARTGPGHTPLQVACALGRVDAAEALLDAGADLTASSPNGTAREIAVAEGQDALVAVLDRRSG